jgi:hypothetical protein
MVHIFNRQSANVLTNLMGPKLLVNQSFAIKNNLTTSGNPDIATAQICALAIKWHGTLELS